MRNVTITIPVEAKVRELDEKVLLAAKLAADRNVVVLGPDTSVDPYAEERGTDVHFVNGAASSPQRTRILSTLARRGTKVLLLDTEGANAVATPTFHARFDAELVPHIDRYLAWGHGPAELAIRTVGFPRDKVVVTGLPRFDTLRPPFDAIHEAARRSIRERHGRYVLLNTNLTRANPFATGVVRDLAPDLEMMENQRALMKAYAEAIPAIVRAVPNVNIIVRPHPGENVETYEKMFAGESRIRVVHEGSVQPWIKEAVAVIHNNCLTGVEAVVAGIPVVALSPTGWTQADFTIANAVSNAARNTEELVAFIEACAAGRPPPSAIAAPKTKDALRNIVDNVDQFAIDVVARVVSESAGIARTAHVDVATRARRSALAVLGTRGTRALRKITHARNIAALNYSLHKMSGITRGEVEVRLASLTEALRLPKLTVRPIRGFEHTFRIARA